MKKSILVASLVLLLCFPFSCRRQAREDIPAAITEAEAKTIAQKYVDSRNTANLALLDEIYAPGVVVHDSSAPADIIGLDALKAQYSNTHKAIPDLKAAIDDMIVQGDKIAWRWTFSGTQSGLFHTPMGDLPPTDKKVAFSGVAIDRLEKGKIVEEWVYFNVLNFLFQLGFTVTPPQPPAPPAEK